MAATKKKISSTPSDPTLTARHFLAELDSLAKPSVAANTRYFTGEGESNKILGVRMATLFSLAKEFTEMPLKEIEKLLDNDYYEARMGAVSMMDFQARDKKVTPARRKELYDLYIRRHDRINNWDLVDRSAPYVVGGHLFDKSRTPLYKLARSKNVWERRTAIVSTYFFIRQNDLEDTFRIAEMLVHDKHDLIQKAVGSWVREAGKRDHEKLLGFLNRHAATMPRVTLRYAIEKLDSQTKNKYMTATK
jgi:3-methyladenine DNA glycosylase AlkD